MIDLYTAEAFHCIAKSYRDYINNLITIEPDENCSQNTRVSIKIFLKVSERRVAMYVYYITGLYNGNILVDSTAKVKTLNSHSKSVFTSEDHSCILSYNKGDSLPHALQLLYHQME